MMLRTFFCSLFLCFHLIVNSQDEPHISKFNFSINTEYSIFNPVYLASESQFAAKYSISKRCELNVTLGFMFRSIGGTYYSQVEKKRQNHFFFPVYLNWRYKIKKRWIISLGFGYSFLNYEDQTTASLLYVDDQYTRKPGLGFIIPLMVDYKVFNFLSVYTGVKYYQAYGYHVHNVTPRVYEFTIAPTLGLSYHIPSCRPKTKTIE